jgi:hypothetical protein
MQINISRMKRIFIIIMTLALLSCAKSVDVQDNNFSVYDASGQTPKTIDVPADGQAEYKLRIMSGNNWILKISEGGEWISASLTSGPKGIREVTIDFAKNKEVVPRTGRMDFICASKTVSIAVKQEKGEEAVTPEPNDPPVTPPAPSGLVADILASLPQKFSQKILVPLIPQEKFAVQIKHFVLIRK